MTLQQKNRKISLGVLCLAILMVLGCKKQDVKPDTSNDTNLRQDSLGHHIVFDPSQNKGRLAWQKPEMVIKTLGDLSDKTVVDIGAGSGFFTFRLAKKAKKVIATDINPDMLELIKLLNQNLDSLQRSKIETRLVDPSSTGLQNGEADVAIIINTIGYITDRKTYLSKLYHGLSPGALLLIVDFNADKLNNKINPEKKYLVSKETLINDLENVGYNILNVSDKHLTYQYMIWAVK